MALTPGTKILISDLNLMPRSFASTAARDAYYTANPGLKVPGIVAVIGTGASYREYRWNGAAWAAPMRQQGVTNLPAQTIAAGGGAGYVTVTFAVPFDSVPQVFVNINAGPGSSSSLVPRALSITTDGFGAYVYNVNPSAAAVLSSPLELGWFASV